MDARKPESKSEDTLLRIQQQVMNECTFQPSTNPLPEDIYPASSKFTEFDSQPFVERAMRWKERKRNEYEEKSKMVVELELQQCTFKPQINPQLPQNSFLSSDFGRMDDGDRGNIYDKLYREANRSAKQKEEYSRKEAEEQLRRDCTFHPKITYNKKLSPSIVPRYQETKKIDPRVIQTHLQEQESECTFHPKTNGVNKHRFSTGGQMYLSTNPFERLSKAVTPVKTQEAGSQDDISARSRLSFGSTTSSKRPSSASLRNSEISFEQFWERHVGRENKKKQKIEFLASKLEPTHQPELNKKSLQMVRNKADFLTRVQHHLSKKEEKINNKQEVPEKDCTFQPKINAASKKLPARTFEDMSLGDYERVQKNVTQKKEMLEDYHRSALTFQPQTTGNKNYNVSSFLRLREDPDNYLKRLREMEDKKKAKIESMKEELENKELSHCTFRPKTHDAPDYVKRISESMKLLAKSQKSEEPQKPEWR